MKVTILMLMLQLCLIKANSQNNYQPGLIHKNSGEVMNGWIDYREWDRNPEGIRFKETLNGEAGYYSHDSISLFEITGKERYKKAIVSKDMRPVDLEQLTSDAKDSIVIDTVFLQELVNSPTKLSLYRFYDGKNHYYIKDSTADFEELNFKVYLNEKDGLPYLDERPIYRYQLSQYIKDEPNFDQLQSKLDKIRYNEKELGAFVNRVNDEDVSTGQKNGKKGTSFFISGGLMVSTLKIEGFPNISDMDYSTSLTPAFGIGVDFIAGRNLSQFIIRLAAGYSTLNYNGKKTDTDWLGVEQEKQYNLKVTSITPSVSVLYSFFRNSSYRVYTGIGLGVNFSSYPVNEYVVITKPTNETSTKSNYFAFEEGWMSTSAHLGIIIKNRFEITTAYNFAGTFSNYLVFTLKPNMFSFGVAYRL